MAPVTLSHDQSGFRAVSSGSRTSRWLRAGGWVIALAFLFPANLLRAEAGAAFGIHVIDEATGRGVPMVTLETNNRISLVTDSAGWAAFDEPGMMGRRVFFAVRSPGYAFAENTAGVAGIALDAKAGGRSEVKVMRLGIAERLYRVTGQGIYREATRLGEEVPLPRPNMNGTLITHGAARAAVFKNQIFWLWSDAQGMQEPRAIAGIGAATSELPGKGGLDPSLGVHFEYSHADRVFKSDDGGRVQLESLIAVKNANGQERLVAHYSRFGGDGARIEHGIAEFNEQAGSFEPVTSLGEEFGWQCPRGHGVRVKTNDGDFFYFADPFCTTRVPASFEDVLDPSKYEALAFSAEAGAVVWQKQDVPITPAEEDKLVEHGTIDKSKARLRVANAADGKALSLLTGNVEWNRYRKKWVILGAEYKTGAAKSGRLWYAEANQADGPWTAATCVVNDEPLGLSDPLHLEAFDQEDGKVIYFDATLWADAPGAQAVPRYDRNRVMFRLDLRDRRLSVEAR